MWKRPYRSSVFDGAWAGLMAAMTVLSVCALLIAAIIALAHPAALCG